LYDVHEIRGRSGLVIKFAQAFGITCLVMTGIYYFGPNLSVGRRIMFVSVPVLFSTLLGWRLLLNRVVPILRPSARLLVVGTGASGISLVTEIIHRDDSDLKVVGFLDEKGENIGKSLVNPGIIGATWDLESIATREKVDHVVLSLLERRGQMPLEQLLKLKFAGIKVDDAHSLYERIAGRIMLEHLSPSWLILSEGFRHSTLILTLKRVVDVVVSLLGLIIAAPIMGLTSLAVLIESGRPIMFRQSRIGLNGRRFTILKFRSMYHGSERLGPTWTTDDDARITKVGRFIRKCRIDELPQLLNVLRGEMSLVGPRPEQPHFCDLLAQQIPYYKQRHSVRPGITGWAQIKYRYGASLEESKTKLEYDLFYIKHLSIPLDLAILFETGRVLLSGRGAR
jgi:sugar transferase (PEP-CTERM system associated)